MSHTLAEVHERLASLRRHMLDGWGPGTPPTARALAAVQATAEHLAHLRAPMPTVVRPLPDGGMEMQWAHLDGGLQVHVAPIGHIAGVLGEQCEGTKIAATPMALGLLLAEEIAAIDALTRHPGEG